MAHGKSHPLYLSKLEADGQELLCGKDVPRYNEAALANVLADVKFIEDEIRRLEKGALDKVLEEVRLASLHERTLGTN
jgi:hypothetical protein